MAFVFSEASFTPIITVIGCVQNRIPVVPIAEYVSCHIIGIDILRILKPLMMQNLGSYRSLD